MHAIRYPMLAAAAAASLALAACGDNSADDGAPAETAATDSSAMADAAATPVPADHAAQFLTDAMKGDNSEIRVTALAAEKATDPAVKDFAAMLQKDHSAHLEKLTALAQTMSVPVTTETKPDADALYAKLQGLSGAEFDKTFVSAMIENHKKGIANYEQESASSDPAPLVALAKETVPTLKKHLEAAQSLS